MLVTIRTKRISLYMPVISQAVDLSCTDPYLWYTVIPWHNNDLNENISLLAHHNTGHYKSKDSEASFIAYRDPFE